MNNKHINGFNNAVYKILNKFIDNKNNSNKNEFNNSCPNNDRLHIF